ncbi:MAG: hypothetical protein HC884_04740 [Chloroflexaceae bacterium]|nr:hypothetical protein [Chloroflexaceae bacterium]
MSSGSCTCPQARRIEQELFNLHQWQPLKMQQPSPLVPSRKQRNTKHQDNQKYWQTAVWSGLIAYLNRRSTVVKPQIDDWPGGGQALEHTYQYKHTDDDADNDERFHMVASLIAIHN